MSEWSTMENAAWRVQRCSRIYSLLYARLQNFGVWKEVHRAYLYGNPDSVHLRPGRR